MENRRFSIDPNLSSFAIEYLGSLDDLIKFIERNIENAWVDFARDENLPPMKFTRVKI